MSNIRATDKMIRMFRVMQKARIFPSYQIRMISGQQQTYTDMRTIPDENVPVYKPRINEEFIDFHRMRTYRLNRLRQELIKKDCGACLLYDPNSIRYALDTTNMPIFNMHNLHRYAMVTADGPTVLFEMFNCEHMSEHLELVDELRDALAWEYYPMGPLRTKTLKDWSGEIHSIMKQHCGGNMRLAVDVCDSSGIMALHDLGIELIEAKTIVDRARRVKNEDELLCVRGSVKIAEIGIQRIKENLQAGITEEELWSHLHKANIENGGGWLASRLLTSGVRTNPWMNEVSNKIIGRNELVAFDTDLVGLHGYWADVSRTFVEGGKFNSYQKKLYEIAAEQVAHNSSMVKAGLHCRVIQENSYKVPAEFFENRYFCLLHGIGLSNETPFINEVDEIDDVLEKDMVVCMESYIGAKGGKEGVKIEQQFLITEDGTELLSTYPLETF